MEIPQEIKDKVFGNPPDEVVETDEVETELELEADDGSQEEAGASEEIAEGSEAEGFTTLEEVLTDAEWSQEDFYNLKMKSPLSGEEVTLQEWKDAGTAAQRDAEALQRKYDQQAEQMRQMQQQTQVAQQQDQTLMQMQGQSQAIDAYLQSPEYAQLKVDDPGQAALRGQEALNFKAKIQQQAQQHSYQQQQQRQQADMQRQQRGAEYLVQHIPEWRDEAVKKEEQRVIAEAFQGAGYTQQDISSLSDPRAVMLVRELVSLRKQVAGGKVAAEKVRQTPKRSLRTGRFVNGGAKKRTVDRAKQTGSRADTMAAARAIYESGARK